MNDVEHIGRRAVLLSNGVRVPCQGTIAEAQVYDETLIVVLKWISGRRRTVGRRLRHDNVYGYDLRGRRCWRVGTAKGEPRGLYYVGFVEDAPRPTLLVATGWYVTLDERTGRVLLSECAR